MAGGASHPTPGGLAPHDSKLGERWETFLQFGKIFRSLDVGLRGQTVIPLKFCRLTLLCIPKGFQEPVLLPV